MKEKFYKKLSEYAHELRGSGFMCHFECFMEDFGDEHIPFTDRDQFLFPILKGTKYADGNAISIETAKALGKLSQIPESFENHYEQKLSHVLNLLQSGINIFTEHSLFLMKEHCKLFSPYSEKAKELLNKLEGLENGTA